ncbi:MAG: hypothetical protein H0V82_04210 [Candidatus Protochlamydia sp.]|nr:hypothetical protein [Candidatus Protochlamydia sp.]
MQLSLQSTFYLAINTGVGALSLYKTPMPYHWLGAFAAGLLAGSLVSKRALNKAQNGYNPGNGYGMGWSENNDRQIRTEGARYLITNSFPGFIVTTINCVALAVINKAPLLERFFAHEPVLTLGAAMCLGYTLGHFFSLDILRRSQNPTLRDLLSNAVV